MRQIVSVGWIAVLLAWALLHACLLAHSAAYSALVEWFDRPGPAWCVAIVGCACILSVSVDLLGASAAPRTTPALLSAATLVGYSYHLFLFRWPWLTGIATSDCRLSAWAATLSSTYRGMPLIAFGELLSVALILTHGFSGLFALSLWQRWSARSNWMRTGAVAIGMCAYLLVGAALLGLATGRR